MGRPMGGKAIGLGKARSQALCYLESPEYQKSLADRIKNGTLPPAIEVMLWYYAYGKPVDNVALHSTSGAGLDVQDVPIEALRERLKLLQAAVEVVESRQKLLEPKTVTVEAERV